VVAKTRSLGLVAPNQTSAEPFRVLRLSIEARLGRSHSNAILFTSPRPRDGKSTIAANFALVTALRQTPVLLIDCDLRNPTLDQLFGLPRSPGVAEALRDGLEVREVAHEFPSFGPLTVVTAGAPLPRPADIAASPAMADFIFRAREEYEVVVIDSPPTLIAADASSLAAHPGVEVVMVIKPTSRRRHVISALRKLALTEARVLGLVVNREGSLASYTYA
jgi:tyrosine-protein kinase Etk/Wzc